MIAKVDKTIIIISGAAWSILSTFEHGPSLVNSNSPSKFQFDPRSLLNYSLPSTYNAHMTHLLLVLFFFVAPANIKQCTNKTPKDSTFSGSLNSLPLIGKVELSKLVEFRANLYSIDDTCVDFHIILIIFFCVCVIDVLAIMTIYVYVA